MKKVYIPILVTILILTTIGLPAQQSSLNIDNQATQRANRLSSLPGLDSTQLQQIVVLEKQALLCIDSLQKNGSALTIAVRQNRLKSLEEYYDTRMKSILNLQQYTKYKDIADQNRKRMEEMIRNRKNNKSTN